MIAKQLLIIVKILRLLKRCIMHFFFSYILSGGDRYAENNPI